MHPQTLAGVVLPVTALLYGWLGVRRRRPRRQRYRATVRRLPVPAGDPYRAAACESWWPEDDTQAAASQLLLEGLATVNHRGNLSLTPAGADPARTAGHPLPDALLAALRRRTAPATLGSIELRDTAFRTTREEFRSAWRTRVRATAARGGPGRPATTGVYLLLAEMVFTVFALAGLAPRGPVQGWVVAATGLALVAQIVWFPLYARSRRRSGPTAIPHVTLPGPRHPALAELARRDPLSTDRLRVSRLRTRRGRNRGRPRRRTTTGAAGGPADGGQTGGG
ncbi:hypothetical protein ABZ128_28605 [Streptomyces sp. NPDC006326]|uniref:hypothetical protein n=1 Tax=Streptomyces sp. NPDC006326 TaxID=3156752 RepID=UPI0033B0C514